MDFTKGRANMSFMRDRIQDALTHKGLAVGIAASGLEYLFRPAKDFPNARLVEVYRGTQLMETRTMTDLCLWADRIGIVITEKSCR